MEFKHTSLAVFLKRALRHVWLITYGTLWSLFGTLTRLRDNFLSDPWKQRLGTQRLFADIPAMGWRTWVIGIVSGIIVAIVYSGLRQLRDEETRRFDLQAELNHVRQVPLSAGLMILEMIFRASFETHAVLNRDLFLRMSADLASPLSSEVSYSLDAILRGKTIPAVWLRDVENWCRAEVIKNANPFSPLEDKPCYNMDELPTSLRMGEKVDGWLHFRLEGMTDGLLKDCSLRLTAKSNHGASTVDVAEKSFPFFGGQWRVIRKEDERTYALRSQGNPMPPPV